MHRSKIISDIENQYKMFKNVIFYTFYTENSDKTPLTELAKNQAFPLFMAACGWRRPGFFTPSVTFENRASRSPDVFLDGWKKNCSRCVDISSYRERVMVMALYGRMHFAQRICCIQTFFFNKAKTWQAHVHTGCFFNCFSPFSKWQNVLCQWGDFIHWIFPKIVALVGCNSFFILALKIEGSS